MNRLHRFEEYRFIGTRDSMEVYDCDEPDQFTELKERVETGRLLERKQLQSFSPDTLTEATNRGFQPVKSSG